MKRKILSLIVCAAVFLGGCSRVSEEPVGGSLPKTITPGNPGYSSGGGFVSPVYEALSDYEKSLYDKISAAVAGFDDFVVFDEAVPKDTVRKIYRLFYAQERNYFWLSSLFYAPEEEISSLRLNYIYEKEDAELKRAELDIAASIIIGELPENASAFDAAVYFHDAIVTGCEFSQTNEHVNSAYGVLVDGFGQCEGYAAAMSLLCTKAGIPNYTVCGTNERGETHAWNKIMIDGQWYNSDCTWDDPILKVNNPDFVRHDYCLVSDAEINGITHFPDELYDGVPACTATEKNYFAGKGLLYDTAAEASEAMKEQIKAAGLSGKREAELRLSGDDAYYAAMARFFDSGEIRQIIENVNGNYGTKIRSAYKHNNDKLNIIHISLIYESDEE